MNFENERKILAPDFSKQIGRKKKMEEDEREEKIAKMILEREREKAKNKLPFSERAKELQMNYEKTKNNNVKLVFYQNSIPFSLKGVSPCQ